jgi:hypothetical protein
VFPRLGFAKVSRDEPGDECEADDDDGSPTIAASASPLPTAVPAHIRFFVVTTSCHHDEV